MSLGLVQLLLARLAVPHALPPEAELTQHQRDAIARYVHVDPNFVDLLSAPLSDAERDEMLATALERRALAPGRFP